MKETTKGMNVALWVVAALAAALFLVAGGAKFFGVLNDEFIAWGYTRDFATVVGILEVIGAVALLFKRTAGWAALGLMVIMSGAIWTHATHGEYVMLVAPITVLLMLGFVVWGRGLSWERQSSTQTQRPSPSPS